MEEGGGRGDVGSSWPIRGDVLLLQVWNQCRQEDESLIVQNGPDPEKLVSITVKVHKETASPTDDARVQGETLNTKTVPPLTCKYYNAFRMSPMCLIRHVLHFFLGWGGSVVCL